MPEDTMAATIPEPDAAAWWELTPTSWDRTDGTTSEDSRTCTPRPENEPPLAVIRRLASLAAMLLVLLASQPALAQVAGLDGLVGKIQQFNGALIMVGGALSVTGFIWAVASLTLGLAGAAKAVMCLLGGLAIAAAPQIVGFFTGFGG